MTQRPEAGGLEIKTDDEQQKHHAQFGEMQQFFTIGNKTGNRADNHTGGQIAQNGSQPHTLEQWCGNDCPAEDHQGLQIKTADGNIVFHN